LGAKEKVLDKEIHLLEEKLGLYGRDDKVLHYAPIIMEIVFGIGKVIVKT
jgi:hypothetical protein